jgi:transcription termination/antitermination protein NusG
MSAELNWYVVHVKSRQEFVVSAELGRSGVDAFLPSVTKLRQWKDRKKQVKFALFPGYLFVHIPPHQAEHRTVLKTRGVVTFVCLEKGNPTPVPSEEIASLRSMIESGVELDVYPHLELGARVIVRRGPLRDAVGVLVKKENHTLFVVNIGILGRSAGVKVSAEDLEAC